MKDICASLGLGMYVCVYVYMYVCPTQATTNAPIQSTLDRRLFLLYSIYRLYLVCSSCSATTDLTSWPIFATSWPLSAVPLWPRYLRLRGRHPHLGLGRTPERSRSRITPTAPKGLVLEDIFFCMPVRIVNWRTKNTRGAGSRFDRATQQMVVVLKDKGFVSRRTWLGARLSIYVITCPNLSFQAMYACVYPSDAKFTLYACFVRAQLGS